MAEHSTTSPPNVVIIGGGAAGFFAAVRVASCRPDLRVIVLESSNKTLAKVAISGGGRCNVTHHCFDPAELVKSYPRGSKQLRGPFSQFQPKDTVDWFESRGVRIKVEPDGRMFPVSDSSASIIDALESAAREAKVTIRLQTKVRDITRIEDGFALALADGSTLLARSIVLATGSSSSGHAIAARLGHRITPLAPSLFTFNISHPLLDGLAGTSFMKCVLKLRVNEREFSQSGPMLITHWGLSGPAVLRLSAWAARELQETQYQGTLVVNWVGEMTREQCLQSLRGARESNPHRTIGNTPEHGLTRRFWEQLLASAAVDPFKPYSSISNAQLQTLAQQVTATELRVTGKGIFKEEFVTCGGIDLGEVDFRTMESKKQPSLYFAGEILDIDGITGGFNFQNAWTTGWIAGSAIARRLLPPEEGEALA